MTVLVKACLEKIMATLVPAKTLLEKQKIVIKTCNSYHRLVELIVGFDLSTWLPYSDNQSSNYNQFCESLSKMHDD